MDIKQTTNTLKKPRVIIVGFIVALILVTLGIYAFRLNQSNSNQLAQSTAVPIPSSQPTPIPSTNPTPTPFPTPTPWWEVKDEVLGGKYTNFSFRFQFSIEEKYLKNRRESQNDSVEFLLNGDENYPVILSITFPTIGSPSLDLLKECKHFKQNEVISKNFGYIKKLSENKLGCFWYSSPNLNTETEPMWAYDGFFESNNTVIVLGITSSNEKRLSEYKSVFDQAIDSFEFF